MSDEYLVKIKNKNCDFFIEKIQKSPLVAYKKPDHIALKDPKSGSTWIYDIRIFKESEDTLFLEITTPTHELFKSIQKALSGTDYLITEYDGDETITLSKIFRI
ncbi:hypothetical protein [Chromobacterium violaceum]|uniref:hypothetical protein n=1 Tax=Chromobacterium violaceum TaxID=536 RepID=UPI001124D739|nr:hypothetical protein [Chromobacterium violaceum]